MQCFSGWETSRVIGWRNVCVTNVTALEPANFVLIMIVTQGCCRSLCLKGLCHAICYLFKKLKLHQLTSKNNGPALFFKTIFKHWNCLLSSFAKDGKDGHALRLEKVGPAFSSFNAMPEKKDHQKINVVTKCSLMKFVWYLFHITTGALTRSWT